MTLTPVTVLTGPAKAARAALLAGLADDPAAGAIAVVTEGAAGLAADGGESLPSLGCVCCSVRGDVQRGLREMLPRARRGEVRHVVVDCSAGSDPVSILTTLVADPVLALVYRIASVVAVLDGPTQAGAGLGDRARRQVAVADGIVLASDRARHVLPTVQAINPAAWAEAAPLPPGVLLRERRFSGRDAVGSSVLALTIADRLPRDAISRLLAASGFAQLLRVTGVAWMDGETGPVLVESARHRLAPPERLAAWPDGQAPRSHLLFMGDGLDADAIGTGLGVSSPAGTA